MQSAVTFRAMRYFVAAAESGNIHRAAEAMNVTQPALSRTIRDLEDVLGVALFERKKKRIIITDAGKLYLKFAREILALVATAGNMARRLADGQEGVLQIGAVELAYRDHNVKEVLRRFIIARPRVRLDLSPALPNPLPDRLVAGGIDLAFMTNSSAENLRRLTAAGLSYLILSSLDYRLAIPVDHPLCRREEIFAKDLDGLDIIWMLPDIAPETTMALTRKFEESGVTLSMLPFTASEYSRYQLVASGIGITLIASSFVNHLSERVVVRPISDLNCSIQLLMAWKSDNPGVLVRDFVASMAELLAKRSVPTCGRPEDISAPGQLT